ncbi:MAG TPA: hypothetical protein VFM46_00395, partial [Pseudomonadales bacterium]|nr:hypothetical protein [Pseudomonadales bacterium]
EWGSHDWLDFHHAGGWSGSLWRAQDDWQWGYHPYPQLGWIWDPELKKFHTFTRTEIVDVEYVKEPVSGLSYPKKARWFAYSSDATLELETTNLTMKPRETIFPPIGFSLKMSYGNHTTKARLIRRNGEVVDLGNGIATMEHFENVIPDYIYFGPFMLVLLVLSWGARAVAIARAEGRSIQGPAMAIAAGLFSVLILWAQWLTPQL